MSRNLRIDPADSRPIWRQIEESVRHLVASGALAAGASVPSVRDLARDLQVNPATVSKAYQRLTDAGVLMVRRGEGTYVSEAPPELPAVERSRRLLQGALRYASLAVTIGAGQGEAAETLEEAWRSLSSGEGEPDEPEESGEWTSSQSKS
jgi:GntR family transcriptional regulator